MNRLQKAQNATVHTFMSAHPCASLATNGDDGHPNLANVFVYVSEDFNLFFVSRPEHRKHLNILKHPHVALLFTDQETTEQVECTGKAEMLTEANSITEVLPQLQGVLMFHKSKYWVPPVSQLTDQNGYVVMKVTPKEITYRSYSSRGSETETKEISVTL